MHSVISPASRTGCSYSSSEAIRTWTPSRSSFRFNSYSWLCVFLSVHMLSALGFFLLSVPSSQVMGWAKQDSISNLRPHSHFRKEGDEIRKKESICGAGWGELIQGKHTFPEIISLLNLLILTKLVWASCQDRFYKCFCLRCLTTWPLRGEIISIRRRKEEWFGVGTKWCLIHKVSWLITIVNLTGSRNTQKTSNWEGLQGTTWISLTGVEETSWLCRHHQSTMQSWTYQ